MYYNLQLIKLSLRNKRQKYLFLVGIPAHVSSITLNTDKYEAEVFRISLKLTKFIARNFPAVN